ncbi:MAG: hypothetical protein U1F43_07950 [Myxococcota bacterium]
MHLARLALVAPLCSTLALLAGPAAAAPAPDVPAGSVRAERASDLRVDVELDPLAYALSGHSVHVGLGTGRFRFDLGAFALELPTWAHGNDGFTSSFDGFGAKAHAFFGADRSGPFAGIALGVAHTLVQRDGTQLAARDTALSAGVEVGWLVPIVAGLYVKPWVGLGYTFGADDVVLDGQRYSANPIQIFPTVHLGYVF